MKVASDSFNEILKAKGGKSPFEGMVFNEGDQSQQFGFQSPPASASFIVDPDSKMLMLSRGNSLTNPDQQSTENPENAPACGDENLLPESEIWRIFADMARAVKHVHDKGFIHMDIKPSNFFVTKDRTIKLGDFGQAILES